jgi:hypothetical protein
VFLFPIARLRFFFTARPSVTATLILVHILTCITMFSSLSVLVTSLRVGKSSRTIASQESSVRKSTTFYGSPRSNGLTYFEFKLTHLRRFCASCATGSYDISSVPQSPKGCPLTCSIHFQRCNHPPFRHRTCFQAARSPFRRPFII